MSDTSKQVGPMTNCLAYNWRVIAGNTAGTTPSAIRMFTIQSAPPVPPLLLTPSDNKDSVSTTPTFAWQSNDACTQKYHLQLASDTGFTAFLIDSTLTDSTLHVTTDLDTVTRYYWRVKAGNSVNAYGAYSAYRNFRTTSIVLPQIPMAVFPPDSAEDVSLTPTFTWHKINSAKSYHWQLATDQSFTNIIFEDSTIIIPDTSKLSDSLLSCTTYFWHVNAKNVAGVSAYSPVRSFTTVILPPVPPLLLAPRHDSVDVPVGPTFIWNSSFCSVVYQLQIARDSSFTTITFDDSTILNTSFGPAGLPLLSGRSYYFWHVRAKNSLGVWGDWTSTWRFKTTPVGTANWSIPITVCEKDSEECDEVYFGIHPNATYGIDPSLGEYELPDAMPGFFDLRFVDIASRPDSLGAGVRVNLHHFFTYKQVDSFRVRFLKGFGSYPMTVSWPLQLVKDICDSMLLMDENGGVFVKVRMDIDSVAVVSNSTISSLYIVEYAAYPVGVRPMAHEIPDGYVLYQNYPNPFNPSTKINFALEHAAIVRIVVYDVLGREVALLANSPYSPGQYSLRWNGNNDKGTPMPSGVYYVRMLTSSTSGGEQFTTSRKMLLLK